MWNKVPQIEVDFSHSSVKLRPRQFYIFKALRRKPFRLSIFGSTRPSSQRNFAASFGEVEDEYIILNLSAVGSIFLSKMCTIINALKILANLAGISF